MPFPLQKTPQGLLDLFRLRTLGGNPNQFGEQLVPVTETTPYYMADIMLSGGATNAAAALPITFEGNIMTEPNYILLASVHVVIGAAAGTFMSVGLGLRVNSTTTVFMASANVVAPVAGQTIFATMPPGQFLVPAGSRFVANVTGDAAGADHVVVMRALVAPLRVSP